MAKEGPVKVSLLVQWPTGSEEEELEIGRSEWDAMSPHERTKRINQEAEDFAVNRVGWGWHIDDPDDLAATE